MRTIVYLLRHADYQNPQHVFHGRLPGFPLSEIGEQQAKKLALALKDKPITAIYTSRLLRCFDTARTIAKSHHLKVITDERLLEIRSPTQGRSFVYLESVNWNQYRSSFIALGGERLSEIYTRMRDFLNEKLKVHHAQQFIIVSHGDPIMTLKVKFADTRLSLSNLRRPSQYVAIGNGFVLTFSEDDKLISLEDFSVKQ